MPRRSIPPFGPSPWKTRKRYRLRKKKWKTPTICVKTTLQGGTKGQQLIGGRLVERRVQRCGFQGSKPLPYLHQTLSTQETSVLANPFFWKVECLTHTYASAQRLILSVSADPHHSYIPWGRTVELFKRILGPCNLKSYIGNA